MARRPIADGWHVSNDELGITGVVERLQAVHPTLVVLEATGGLEVPVTGALAEAGLPVVEDMSGNVWEWTRGLSGDYPYPMHQPERTWRENLQADRDAPRVWQGGAFDHSHWSVRCAYRVRDYPLDSSWYRGFRVVVRPAF